MEDKKTLRQVGKQLLQRLSDQEKEQVTKQIHHHLFESDQWKHASVIGCTISQSHEIDTHTIIKKAWEEQKRVVVPKCIAHQKELVFRELLSFEQLETVYFGLKEPIESETKEVTKDTIELMLVPGLIFDSSGYRIGYGGGFYDRYLKHFKNKTIALATESQLVDEVPISTYDIPVHHLITEKGFRF